MFLLAISLATSESELDTMDDQHQGCTLIQSLMLTGSHVEIIVLMLQLPSGITTERMPFTERRN